MEDNSDPMTKLLIKAKANKDIQQEFPIQCIKRLSDINLKDPNSSSTKVPQKVNNPLILS